MNKQIRGYCVIIPVMFGIPSLWTVEEIGIGVLPEVFSTEEEAWKEIAKDQITTLQQYVDGQREYDHVDWNGPEEYVAQIMMDDHDNLLVYDEGMNLIAMTITEWRESL